MEAHSVNEDCESSSSIFFELKQYCIQLLELHQNPKNKDPSSLSNLFQLLRRSSPRHLQPFFDYTLFPLLLLLDAAIDSRSSSNVDSNERFMVSNIRERPHTISDVVMEGALHCLEELLKKCCLSSVDQFIVLTKKLTRLALLSPLEASEEFREGVVRCFRALLLSLYCCSSESCLCKQISGWPSLLERKKLHSPPLVKLEFKEKECLVAFLQSETASVAVGHWLSLLLKAADVEAARGQQGSASIRIEAFSTLRMLVAKVGTADALAFFLPGVVSQIGKVLRMSKTFISGAAGSAEALDQAVRCLAEFLMIVLEDNVNSPFLGLSLDDVTGLASESEKSSVSLLEKLRQLPSTMHDQNSIEAVDKTNLVPSSRERESVSPGNMTKSLRVIRTKDWIGDTTSHVDKLLCATYPHLCMHPSKKVRQGLLAAIQGLLSKSSCVLKGSRLMLLESLCNLACDDSEEVSSASQQFFGYLLSSQLHIKHDVPEIFNRLVEKLPKVVLGTDESYAIAHAQKLLVMIYFSGPRLVADYLLQSPVKAAQFLDVLALCLSQNSVFAGSLEKHVAPKTSSSGFLHSLAEIRAVRTANSNNLGSRENHNRRVHATENIMNEHQLPHMPPWFVFVGSQRLYHSLAGILRLVGLSLFADSRSAGPLSVIIDFPLENLRKLISEIRMKEYTEESWQSWYSRITSGQLVRQASTAVCVLNELIFGLSDRAIDNFFRMFGTDVMGLQEHKKYQEDESQHSKIESPEGSVWKICQVKGERSHLVDCIGSILHEYLSPEIWSLPVAFQQSDSEDTNISSHFFNDNVMLHQVIIDGIGIFSMCLGKEFSLSGFLHSSLYMLLDNLICSHFQIRSTSDAVLHIIAAMHDYPTVGHLVIANSDYVIDSICRQLRSLELNPDVPHVLAAMLSYVGVANSILPLLEEPMRAVSMEIEILGRHRDPDLTVPFLKAMAEIVKASKHEASVLLDQAKSYCEDVESRKLNLEKMTGKHFDDSGSYGDGSVGMVPSESGMSIDTNDGHIQMEWETMLFKMSDFRRYRRTVGSIVGSCLTAATPLLASEKQAASLVALDIVEDGFSTVAKVECAYKHEKEIKEAIEHVAHRCSFYSLKDSLDVDVDETSENRLLPAANKVWPFLVACLRSKSPVAIRRCTHTISCIVQICGGDFFTRRFHTDGKHLWSLLSTSPFQKRAPGLGESQLKLPFRGASASSGDSVAEISDLKVQAAVLNLLADLAQNKHSASALDAVLKKVSGLVTGIACSGVVGLRDAAVNALTGLASIDPDLIWLLLADVYYSKKRDPPIPPIVGEFLEISQILPPPLSSKDYLYLQYGGQSYGFDVDYTSVEAVFRTLHSQVFSSQMYS